MATFARFLLSIFLLHVECSVLCQAGTPQYGHGHSGTNHALLHKRALIISTNLPANWTSLGCYTDNVGGVRALSAKSYTDTIAMTEESCINFCATNGYGYAGVEYSQECYCGNYIYSADTAAAAGDCSMACSGNSAEQCGGPNRLNMFHNTAAPASGPPTTNPGPPGWGFMNCYTDNTGARTLTYGAQTQGGASALTVALCTQACQSAGFNISGVEYSGECYCGNQFSNGGAPASDGLTGCSMVCNGNSSEFCGGANRLDVYGLGYVNRSSSTSSSTTTSTTPVATTSSTLTTTTTTSKASTTSTTTLSSSSVPLTSTTTSSSSTSATPTATGNWTYQGCWVDNQYGRILGSPTYGDNNMTIEKCENYCQGQGYTIAGLEYSTQCNCGNAIINGGQLGQNSDCAMTCGGNPSEICGGPNRMSIYSTVSNYSIYAPPTVKNTSLPGSWQYQGCLQDVPGRTLPYMLEMPTNLTVEYCLSLCSKYGYGAAGVEYSYQCFCGDDTDRINNNATWLSPSSCNMACAGSPSELCGGGNALNYYTWSNLTHWNQASGNAAGQYKFLIGGVVIPLMTTANRNGKVTFVEKHGTGPPNSTGAYELDLSQVNNFTAAWRTMNGLQTDVFCSAGLVLPDKVGRQINIGGWSGTSTYGVRLYWPDGAPGVPGVNDWQENANEIHLQTGRWYPTAMQMVNGSILVVGGENGSNGPPVPNLEVIPTPPGGPLIYCDWLNRTDPNNLYPFLAVLPSGKIFVAYYNEARILDPVSLQTVQTLPNIPGAVNNPLGGRTYPMEGTSMLLPQAAPYTDPLGVLICGGSTPGPAIALDNCVTLQPEVSGANWTIERMPSKRVMPSMVALPDGTYLIMNGAQQGVAGFGLASNPNLNALIYDPRQPIGNRITSLANTTIARLYHNEAILLMDGRVLVSGSDPEDGVHPQEYRVEIFIPPYLMALNEPLALNVSNPVNPAVPGSTTCGQRPAYTINNNQNDLQYGQSITITMACGTAAKVSLMGAVSSTHGNSMGQRTIFPAFSCSGTQCTITMPPNGNITGGPGWFMMFVLDGNNVPSVAQWVRIGGDPAGLGNWPNYPDFKLPGV